MSEEKDPPVVASERIAMTLREEILSGRFGPGSILRQDRIAAELGSSRLPVREALRILETQGLVTLRANNGARVMRLDLRECQAIYRVRERVEPIALTESIPFLSDAAIERLEAIHAEIETGPELERFLELDREFHLTTYSGCDIAFLTSLVNRLWDTTQHYRRLFNSIRGEDRDWVVVAEHRLLIDAIRQQDAEEASRILASHYRRSRQELAHHPELFEIT